MDDDDEHGKRLICRCGNVIQQCRCGHPKEDIVVQESCAACREKKKETTE
jgi:hypothetical protein